MATEFFLPEEVIGVPMDEGWFALANSVWDENFYIRNGPVIPFPFDNEIRITGKTDPGATVKVLVNGTQKYIVVAEADGAFEAFITVELGANEVRGQTTSSTFQPIPDIPLFFEAKTYATLLAAFYKAFVFSMREKLEQTQNANFLSGKIHHSDIGAKFSDLLEFKRLDPWTVSQFEMVTRKSLQAFIRYGGTERGLRDLSSAFSTLNHKFAIQRGWILGGEINTLSPWILGESVLDEDTILAEGFMEEPVWITSISSFGSLFLGFGTNTFPFALAEFPLSQLHNLLIWVLHTEDPKAEVLNRLILKFLPLFKTVSSRSNFQATLLEKVVVESTTYTDITQPTSPSTVIVVLEGMSGSGIDVVVTVTGTDEDDAPLSEVLAFSDNTTETGLTGEKVFKTITEIEVVVNDGDTVDATIEILESVGRILTHELIEKEDFETGDEVFTLTKLSPEKHIIRDGVTRLSEKACENQNELLVEDVSGFTVGSRIRLYNDIFKVSAVDEENLTLSTETPLTRAYARGVGVIALFTVTGEVTSVESDSVIEDSSKDFLPNELQKSVLTFLTGAEVGESFLITSNTKNSYTLQPGDYQTGDLYEIVRGNVASFRSSIFPATMQNTPPTQKVIGDFIASRFGECKIDAFVRFGESTIIDNTWIPFIPFEPNDILHEPVFETFDTLALLSTDSDIYTVELDTIEFVQGIASNKVIFSPDSGNLGENESVYRVFTESLDLSKVNEIQLNVRSSIAGTDVLRLGLGVDLFFRRNPFTPLEFSIDIDTPNTWELKTFDLTSLEPEERTQFWFLALRAQGSTPFSFWVDNLFSDKSLPYFQFHFNIRDVIFPRDFTFERLAKKTARDFQL